MLSKDSQWPQGVRGLKQKSEEKTLLRESVLVERKEFTLELKENHLGKFLRITEISGGHYNRILIPASGLANLKRVLDEVVRLASVQEGAVGEGPKPGTPAPES